MSTARRRRLAAASFVAFAGLALSACGTSFGAQTNQVYQPGVGANERGEIESHNTQLVGNTDGSATLSATLLNTLDEPQTLTGVTIANADGDDLKVRSPKIALPLPSDELTVLGKGGGIYVATEGATPGSYVTITYSFDGPADLTVRAPVVARADHAREYEDVAGGDGIVPSELSGTSGE